MKPNNIKAIVLALASVGLATLPARIAFANPIDGKVVAGNVTIQQESATKLGIIQATNKAIVDWKSFSIGAKEHTQIYQPSASAVILNRVVGEDPSQILGRMTANGKVFLVNPNGILFGKNAQIDVASLVASTHNIRNEDFLAGNYSFNIPGKPGASVINEGTIRIADTGIAAFFAPSVANRGVIVARLGKVALAAANGFTLDFQGDQLLSFLVGDDVARTAFDIEGKQLTSFVENSGRIEAQGGHVLLTAKAAENAIHSVINQSGSIEARTVENRKGEILLLGSKNGTVEISGTLDASAPDGGDGGFVETSGADVRIAETTRVSTTAAYGKTGTWLIDPNDYTIAASGGNITGAALSSNLGSTSVTISTATQGSPGGNGDIFVNDEVNWTTGNSLTLNAERHIYVYAGISNMNGNLVLHSDINGTGIGTVGFGGSGTISHNSGRVDIFYNPASYSDASTKSDNLTNPYSARVFGAANYTSWMLVNNVVQLQAMNTNLRGIYALGKNIDASASSSWNGGAGFFPIAHDLTQDNATNTFLGALDGLGRTITGLTVNRPSMFWVGLFAQIGSSGIVRNVNLTGIHVTGRGYVGGMAGENQGGTIRNSYVSGTVVGGIFQTGGLLGRNSGTVSNSYSEGSVTGTAMLGGLVGDNVGGGNIGNSYSMASVTSNAGTNSSAEVGGLVGYNYASTIVNSYSAGFVTGGRNSTGGLVGSNSNGGTASNSYWNTTTSGRASSAVGTGLTSAQMKSRASFSGWDFSNTWTIVEGVSPPTLIALSSLASVPANNSAVDQVAVAKAAAARLSSQVAAQVNGLVAAQAPSNNVVIGIDNSGVSIPAIFRGTSNQNGSWGYKTPETVKPPISNLWGYDISQPEGMRIVQNRTSLFKPIDTMTVKVKEKEINIDAYPNADANGIWNPYGDFQCTALIAQYLSKLGFNYPPLGADGQDVVSTLVSKHGTDFAPIDNKVAPKVGSILSMNSGYLKIDEKTKKETRITDDGVGHVAIVKGVTLDPNNKDKITVTLIEQNIGKFNTKEFAVDRNITFFRDSSGTWSAKHAIVKGGFDGYKVLNWTNPI